MKSTIDKKGRTTIPTEIRQHFNLAAGDQLEWVVNNDKIWIIPVVEDPIAAFRGSGQGGSTARLLVDRANDTCSDEKGQRC
jgi:AbrB family looped-hinge helix DNA binding protein